MTELILSGLFVLVLGAYGYTYRVDRRITELFLTLRDNHIKHLEERVARLEDEQSGD